MKRAALAVAVVAAFIGGFSLGRLHVEPRAIDVVATTTAAIASGDIARARSAFDDQIRPQVTPATVAALAQIMQRYGPYEHVEQVSEIPARRRYDFEAYFVGGSMLVQLRLDADGKIAAYHIIPNGPSTLN